MRLTITAFNIGSTRSFTNGPGISLINFVNSIKSEFDITVFVKMRPEVDIDGVNIFKISNKSALKKAISKSDCLHHWSGISNDFVSAGSYANKLGIPVIIGPNVLDTFEIEKERVLLSRVAPQHILCVNDRLKYKVSKEHNLPPGIISTLIIGPDTDLWSPSPDRERFIMWKGNSLQYAKDIGFGLKLAEKLPQYEFRFFGYPRPYSYFDHISEAKRASLYVGTSISETKSHALMESWSSGVCSVTHPKIYLHGENYKTGIITSKNLEDYSEAIIEIMENQRLREDMGEAARQYAIDSFSKWAVQTEYRIILGKL